MKDFPKEKAWLSWTLLRCRKAECEEQGTASHQIWGTRSEQDIINGSREEPRETHWIKNVLISQVVRQSSSPDVKAIQSITPASSSPAERIADWQERDSESLGRRSLQSEAFPKQHNVYSATIPSSLFLSQPIMYPDALCRWPRRLEWRQ